jgi:predicted ester cyclase
VNRELVARLGGLASAEDVPAAVASVYALDATFTGSAPLGALSGTDAITSFHGSVSAAFGGFTRKPLLSATYRDASTGHDVLTVLGTWSGTMTGDWLGLSASGCRREFRSIEVHRVSDGHVVDTVTMLDLLDLAVQCGAADPRFAARSTALWPAPRTPSAGDATVSAAVVQTWLGEVADPGEDLEVLRSARHLARLSWDFRWHGPAAIGSFEGGMAFVEGQQHPFRRSFSARRNGSTDSSHRHICHGAEGSLVVSGSWPAMVGLHTGDDWLGVPASGRVVALRLVDVYAVVDGLIGENWVMIDMVHALAQMGVDTGFESAF